MYNLVVRPVAAQIARDAYEWYEEQQSGLGDLFLKELEGSFQKLEDKPYIYAVIKKNFRQQVLKKFPYVVVFEIMDDDVVIFCIFHTSRSPRKKFIR